MQKKIINYRLYRKKINSVNYSDCTFIDDVEADSRAFETMNKSKNKYHFFQNNQIPEHISGDANNSISVSYSNKNFASR